MCIIGYAKIMNSRGSFLGSFRQFSKVENNMTELDTIRSIPCIQTEDSLYVRPQAANKKMRTAQTLAQTVYIYGISGCGKTAFIRSFIGKRRYYSFSAENLGAGDLDIPLGSKHNIVVIDDLHQLRSDDFREGLISKIEALTGRSDVWLILSGRCRMPSWLTPIYYRKMFTVIEEEDLALSRGEMAEYFALWGMSPPEVELDKIVAISKGIGIVARLIATEMKSGVAFDESGIEKMRNGFWDYLDYHVYDQWDVDVQEFLMQVSIVEEFDKRLAEMITGRSDIERIINQAQHMGNFLAVREAVGGRTVYEIRISVRYSMRRRLLRVYTKERWERLYYNAGLYYELEEDTPKALVMYEAYRDMERIAGLLISNARKNPATGHYYELRRYYLALPENMIRESVDLMSAMSMMHAILMNVEESERWYDELKSAEANLSGSAKKLARGHLTYLDIGLPQRSTRGLSDIIKRAGTMILNRHITLPEFSVTSNMPSQLNGGKDFCEWSKRDREIANTIGKPLELTLGKYGKGLLSLALAESAFEKGQDSYEIANLTNKGLMQAQSGGIMEQCFVAVGILVWLNILNNHIEDAYDQMDCFKKKIEIEGSLRLLPNLAAMRTRVDLYRGNAIDAINWMENTPDENVEFATLERYRYLAKLRVYLLLGKNDKALSLAQKLRYYSEVMNRKYIHMESGLLMAIAQYRMGKEIWDSTFSDVMREIESYHFVRLVSREGAAVLRLLKESAWEPKNSDFSKQVISETEKMAVSYPGYLKTMTEEAVFSENAIRILKLQAEGRSASEIAQELNLKLENVKYHNKQNFKKLGVSSKTAAVTEARKRKLI